MAGEDTDGHARADRPAASRPWPAGPGVPAEVREELNRIVVQLGERGLGGTWSPETEFQVHTISELDHRAARHSSDFAKKLEEWSGGRSAAYSDRIHVLMCVWSESWDLWERALTYRTIWVVADAAATFAGAAPPPDPAQPGHVWEYRALCTVGQAMKLLTADSAVFRQMNLSSPDELAVTAAESGQTAGRVLADIGAVLAARETHPRASGDGSATASLHEIESVVRQYGILYTSIVPVAGVLARFERWLAAAPRLGSVAPPPAGEGPSSLPALRQALLESAESALKELRAAQRALEVPILTESEPWEQLLIEILGIVHKFDVSETACVFVPKRASIRYCYPFAVDAAERSLFAQRVRERSIFTRETGELSAGWRVIGQQLQAALDHDLKPERSANPVRVVETKQLEPTEFFAAQDASSRLYDGIRVEFSDIFLSYNEPAVPGGEGLAERCRVWVDLSYMGNHCLCIEPCQPVSALLPHHFYRALRAGTPFVVGATVAVADPAAGPEAAWDDMHVFGRDVVHAVAQAGIWRASGESPPPSYVRGNLHEIVVVRTEEPLAAQLDDVAAKLDEAIGGRIITRSIQRSATTLEEWVRYPPAPRTGSPDHAPSIAAVAEIGLTGDWFTHTGETSIFGISVAPSWHTDVYTEAAQFASSWSPRLRLWSNRLQQAIEELQSFIDQHTSQSPGSDADLENSKKLRSIEGKLRAHLSQIRSEELCATLAHRRFLDQLVEAAGVGRLQGELEAHLAAAERMTDWFNEYTRQQNEKEYRRNEELRRRYEERRRENEEKRTRADKRRDYLLGIIALFGLFDLGSFMSIANSTNFFTIGKNVGRWEDWLMLTIFLAGTVVFVAYITWMERRYRNENSPGHGGGVTS